MKNYHISQTISKFCSLLVVLAFIHFMRIIEIPKFVYLLLLQASILVIAVIVGWVYINKDSILSLDLNLPEINYEEILRKDKSPLSYTYLEKGDIIYRRKGCEKDFDCSIFPEKPEIATINDLWRECVKSYGNNNCLGYRVNGKYVYKDYNHVYKDILTVGYGIETVFPKIKEIKNMGVFGRNTYEFEVILESIIQRGHTVIPMYESLGKDSAQVILEHSQMEIIAVHAEKYLELINSMKNAKHRVSTIILFGEGVESIDKSLIPESIKYYNYNNILEIGAKNKLEQAIISPDDVAYILYTSGTTGVLKGAMLTHNGMMGCARGLLETIMPLKFPVRFVSFLPLAHGFENCVHLALFSKGCSIAYYSGKIPELLNDLKDVKPQLFTCVPRVLETMKAKILTNLLEKPKILQGLISFAFKEQAERMRDGMQRNWLWDRFIFKQLRDVLGGETRTLCVGAALLPPNLKEFIQVMFNNPLIEGYGLTETSAIMTCTKNDYWENPEDTHDDSLNLKRNYEFNHVGTTLCCCEVKLKSIPHLNYTTEDLPLPRGELLCRGPVVFPGYYRDPELTKEIIDEEGWLHSGDIVAINPNGVISIIDRVKNIIKLGQGEFVCLEGLETIYKQVGLIEQIFIPYVSGCSFLVAIIIPNFIELKKICNELNVPNFPKSLSTDDDLDTFESICKLPEVNEKVFSIIKEFGIEQKGKGVVRGFEIFKGIILEGKVNKINQGFSTQNGMLTPTFKMKRNEIKNRYVEVVADLVNKLK